MRKILDKLGLRNEASTPNTSSPAAANEPQPIAVVDVVAQLEQRAKANPQKLNWRTSIVDLLKLLEIDSSFAVELGERRADRTARGAHARERLR